MANKRITLTLEESLVKAFDNKYGDTKQWLLKEFERRAKRSAKESIKKDDDKTKPLDTSKPITLDFLTNPDKE